MKIKSVDQLVQELEKCSDRKEYIDIVNHLHIPVEEIAEFATWSKDHYTRNCIACTEEFELLLLCWGSHQNTPIHCHNGEECWVYVSDGKIAEQRYTYSGEGEPEFERKDILEAGGISFMQDEMGLHRLANPTERRAMTLHLYVEPIHRCRVFSDEDKASFEWKDLVYDKEFHLEKA